MSQASVRQALEARAQALTPELKIIGENHDASPDIDAAYQTFTLIPADPDNSVFGPSYQERGIFQITLCYPVGQGTKPAADRAELVRAWFPRGSSYSSGGVVVTIQNTPAIGPGLTLETEYQLPVKIRWYANVPS